MSFSDYSKLIAVFAIVFTVAISVSLTDYVYANEATSIQTPFPGTAFTSSAPSNSTLVFVSQDDASVLKHNTTYAMAFSGAGEDGFIISYNVTQSGVVTVVSTVEHDTDYSSDAVLVGLDNDATLDCANNTRGCTETFVLTYTGSGALGYVSTFNITDAGTIIPIKAADVGATNLVHDDTGPVTHTDMIMYDKGACTESLWCGNFSIAYQGAGGDGFISTIGVNASGAIYDMKTEKNGGALEHDTGDFSYPSLAAINSENVSLAYTGTGGDGFLSSFNFNNTGAIRGIMTDANGRSLEFDPGNAIGSKLVVINGSGQTGKSQAATVALIYGGVSNYGTLATYAINQTGIPLGIMNVTGESGDALIWDTSGSITDNEFFMVSNTTNNYGIMSNGGLVTTVGLSDDGLTNTFIAQAKTGVLGVPSTALQLNTYDNFFVTSSSIGTTGQVFTLRIDTESLSTTPAPNLGCYDCIPPQLKSTEITISSTDYLIEEGGDLIEITANVGDEASFTIQITDNKDINAMRAAGIYTNYQDRPDNMNLYYSNNYDSTSYGSNVNEISTSFYEWNSRIADVAFDQLGSILWNPVSAIFSEESSVGNQNYVNDNGVVEVLTIPFSMTFTGPIESSEVWVEGVDAAGNHFELQLPVSLTVVGDAPLEFNGGEQKLLAFFDKSYLTSMVSKWNTADGDSNELSLVLGIPDENLPSWTTNLATWVADEKIDIADMIVAVEHIINQ
tara:strand:- start:317 stop:2509 length:2193 start_codon:yes stop_codon:yes gene_type:complete